MIYRYYIKDKFPISTLDDLYIQEGDLLDSLDVIDEGFYHEIGKVKVRVSRNKDKVTTIVLSEYQENTDVTYNSILNSVKDIKPKYYQEFLKEFTELKEISNDHKYSVELLSEEEAKKLDYYEENRKYIRIIFYE